MEWRERSLDRISKAGWSQGSVFNNGGKQMTARERSGGVLQSDYWSLKEIGAFHRRWVNLETTLEKKN